MRGELRPGIAAVVVGPTTTGCSKFVGRGVTVLRQIAEEDIVHEIAGGWRAAGNGWVVGSDRVFSENKVAVFPASSLMPIEPERELEAIDTTAPAQRREPIEV